MAVSEILALVVVLILTWLYIRQVRKGVGYKPIPGPKGIPFLGPTSLLNTSKPYVIFYDLAVKYGRIFQFNLFGQKVVVLNDPALIRKAFSGEEHGNVFFNRPKTFIGKYILVDGSDLAFAEEYGTQTVLFRKMVYKCLQTFSEGLRSFETQTAKEIDALLETIETYYGYDFDMKSLLRTSFGNLMYILLYGTAPTGNGSEMIWELSDNVHVLMETSMNLFLITFPVARLLPGLPGETFRRTSEARDQIFERLTSGSTDAIGLYKTLVQFQNKTNLKYGYDVISDGNVKAILLDVIAGGTSSSVTALAGGILVLLNNRECMRAIQNEIDKVIGAERKPTLADKAEMDYTMACLYELLRYITIGTLGLPHRVAEDTVFEGHQLSKDTLVYGNIWFVHHDPDLWSDPWTFDPHRFIDSNGKLQPPSADCRHNLIPFSVGKRGCPGGDFVIGRMFLYLTTILQAFDLHAPGNGHLLDPDPRSYIPGAFLCVPEYKCQAERRKVKPKV